jgi:hypothetical protein
VKSVNGNIKHLEFTSTNPYINQLLHIKKEIENEIKQGDSANRKWIIMESDNIKKGW